MPSRDYQFVNYFFSLKWNCVFPSPYFFRSIPSSLTNNEEAYVECFPGRRTGEGSGSLPLLPPWLRANSKVKVPSNPSLVKEVRSTRSKSQVKRVYAYDMFIHSWFMLIAMRVIICGMLYMCLLGLGSWYLLVLKALHVSTSQVHDWDVEQLVLEGGMVPDYVNIFRLCFTDIFMCVFMAL